MVAATEVGRDLHLTIEGVAPFVVRPLPARVGEQITATYLNASVGTATAEDMQDALRMALDGAVRDEESGRFVPLPVDGQPNWNRAQDELRTAEAESVLMPAFLWQSVLGVAGVNAYIEAGEGVAGGVKALQALVYRLGLSAPTTSPSTALDDLIRAQVSTPSTSTPQGGAKPGKQPQDRQPKKNT